MQCFFLYYHSQAEYLSRLSFLGIKLGTKLIIYAVWALVNEKYRTGKEKKILAIMAQKEVQRKILCTCCEYVCFGSKFSVASLRHGGCQVLENIHLKPSQRQNIPHIYSKINMFKNVYKTTIKKRNSISLRSGGLLAYCVKM